MKLRMMAFTIAAVAVGSISACGDGGGSGVAMPPPSSSAQALDTAQVLTQARQTSETNDPYPVNNGTLVLSDASDTTEPVSVNGT